MIEIFKNWFGKRDSGANPAPAQDPRGPEVRVTPRPARPENKVARRKKKPTATNGVSPVTIESNGPGKNVLIRNKFVREDTGTHETLKILDDSIVDSGEDRGLDPYNTGGFDRSKNWERRYGK